MSAVLSEAETKFFASGGQDVDPSLKPAETTPEPVKPALAAVPASPQAAPAATPSPAEPVAPAVPQQVPLAALHEERQKRARAEQERQQYQQQLQTLQEQMQQLQRAQQAPPPDPNQDPIGALMYQAKLNQAELEELRKWRDDNTQITQQITTRQQFHQALQNAEATFRAKTPDYDQALNHAMQQYDKLLMAVIPEPNMRRQRVVQEAMGVAYTAMQEGRDPAQILYDVAKNMGYAQSAPANAGQLPTTPQVPQTVPDIVKTIEKGLKQQGNPGGGGSPNSEITPEMALALPADEFNKWWGKQFRR